MLWLDNFSNYMLSLKLGLLRSCSPTLINILTVYILNSSGSSFCVNEYAMVGSPFYLGEHFTVYIKN